MSIIELPQTNRGSINRFYYVDSSALAFLASVSLGQEDIHLFVGSRRSQKDLEGPEKCPALGETLEFSAPRDQTNSPKLPKYNSP
jgi:hypothetical protein